MKKGFLIYKSLYEPIKEFSREQKGELLEAIFEYQISNEVPTGISPIVNMAFLFFKNQFDIDNEKYDERCEKAKRSAKKRWKKPEVKTEANVCERTPSEETDSNDADKRYKIQDTSKKIQDTSKKIKVIKRPTLEDRKIDFALSVETLNSEVGLSKDEVVSFCDYWTEHNENGRQMLYEMKKTFNTKSRMNTWKRNQTKFKRNDSSEQVNNVGTVSGFLENM